MHQLIENQAVRHNTLTLTLPTSTTDRGSLSIGLSPKSHKNMLRIPFANQQSPGLAGTWHVPLTSISLAGNPNLHLPLKSVYASLDLDPTIRLPSETTKQIYEALGAKPNSIFRGASIGCEARAKLPDLVIDIGGNEVRLTRDEYSSQQTMYGYPFCVVGILPSEGEDAAVLGTRLLSKFHVVIDADADELGCKWMFLSCCWFGCVLTCYSGCSKCDFGTGLIIWKLSIIHNIRVPCTARREDFMNHYLLGIAGHNIVVERSAVYGRWSSVGQVECSVDVLAGII